MKSILLFLIFLSCNEPTQDEEEIYNTGSGESNIPIGTNDNHSIKFDSTINNTDELTGYWSTSRIRIEKSIPIAESHKYKKLKLGYTNEGELDTFKLDNPDLIYVKAEALRRKPSETKHYTYKKSNDSLYFKNDAGVEINLTLIGSTIDPSKTGKGFGSSIKFKSESSNDVPERVKELIKRNDSIKYPYFSIYINPDNRDFKAYKNTDSTNWYVSNYDSLVLFLYDAYMYELFNKDENNTKDLNKLRSQLKNYLTNKSK